MRRPTRTNAETAKTIAYFGMSRAVTRHLQARFSLNAVSNAICTMQADMDETQAAPHPAIGSAKFMRTQNAAAYAASSRSISASKNIVCFNYEPG